MAAGPHGWAASGAMALTGDRSGPPLAPAGDITGVLDRLADELAGLAGVAVDGPALLGERAALRGLRRNGRISPGGHTRLLRCTDGWVALALPRPEDVASVAALLAEEVTGDPWEALVPACAFRSVGDLAERAALLSLPLGVLPEPGSDRVEAPAAWRRTGEPGSARSLAGVGVTDLSALWAGPLCAGLLAAAGARVTKVESRSRLDGARRGSRRFWQLLNGAKSERFVELDQLRDEIEAADVVILGARRRVYDQLGVDVEAALRSRSDKVVVAITGHGWDDGRVGFGDDAAVAGGLVARHPDDGRPRFLADAIADPLTGLHAAVAAARSIAEGGRWFVDISLAGVATSVAAAARTDLPARAATSGGRGRPWMLDDERVRQPRVRAETR